MIGISPKSNCYKQDVADSAVLLQEGTSQEGIFDLVQQQQQQQQQQGSTTILPQQAGPPKLPYYLSRHREVFLDSHSSSKEVVDYHSRLDYCGRKTLPHFHSRVHYKMFKPYPSRKRHWTTANASGSSSCC